MPAWRFDEDVLEDISSNEIHKISCPNAPANGQLHAAGSIVERRMAPKRCWKCWPNFELRLSQS